MPIFLALMFARYRHSWLLEDTRRLAKRSMACIIDGMASDIERSLADAVAPQTQPKGQCIFGADHDGVTDEHIFQQWLRDIADDGVTAWELQSDLVLHRDIAMTLVNERRRTKQGSPAKSLRFRVACGECNGGWMDKLDKAAQPILTPLILGEHTIIEQPARDIAVRWATMKAMCVAPRNRDYRTEMPPQALAKFACDQEPFDGFGVWFARREQRTPFRFNFGGATMIHPRDRATVPPAGVGKNGHYLHLALGHLIVQVAWCIVPGVYQFLGNRFGNRRSFIPLWPQIAMRQTLLLGGSRPLSAADMYDLFDRGFNVAAWPDRAP